MIDGVDDVKKGDFPELPPEEGVQPTSTPVPTQVTEKPRLQADRDRDRRSSDGDPRSWP